jgi:hypothetical protein
MMESFSLIVLNIEGLGELTNSCCCFYGDEYLLEKIPMTLAKTKPVYVTESNIKLNLLDDSKNQIISGLCFPKSLIHRPGLFWFPLFANSDSPLTEIPPEVGLPRILFDIRPNMVAPIFDLTESSDPGEDLDLEPENSESLKNKERNLDIIVKVIELEKELLKTQQIAEKEIEELSSEYKIKLSEVNFELERFKALDGKHVKIVQEYVKEIEGLRKERENLMQENKDLHEILNRYVKLYQDTKTRENSILTILETKDKEIMKFGRVNLLREKLQICSQGPISVHTIAKVKFDRMSSDAEDIKVSEIEKNSGKFKILEEVDFRLSAIMKVLNLEGFATLSTEFTYLLGTKKVNIFLKKDILHVKSCGVIKTLENYISNNCAQDIEIFLNKKQTHYKKSHKRSNTFADIESVNSGGLSSTCETSLGSLKLNLNSARFSQILKSVSVPWANP